MDKYVVCIGAANIDIGGAPHQPLVQKDSNPGTISISFGGVARNIAHNLSMLGVDARLVSYVGNDMLGRDMLQYCRSVGINMDYVITDDDMSSMYLFVNNFEGDMDIAISQVKMQDKLTAEHLVSIEGFLADAAIVVMDANLSKEAFLKLKEICKAHGVPLCVEPVSVAQANKIKNDIDGVSLITPNRLEAEFLTDMTINTAADYRAASEEFLRQGVEKIFISMGPEGMMVADKDHIYIVDECPAEAFCTTGAGDSATASIIWALMDLVSSDDPAFKDEDPLVLAAKAANAAASMTILSKETVHPELSNEAVSSLIKLHDMAVTQI